MKFFVTILLLISTLNAYQVADSLRYEAKKVNDLLINCEFDSARTLSENLLRKDSTQPLYYYLKLASVGLETLDRDEVVREQEFKETFAAGMKQLSLAPEYQNDSYFMMMQGFMQTSLSSFNLLDGKYFSAVSVGKDGLKSVETARELDTSNHDLDYYLGFFSYARGELKKRVPILFWLENSSKEGIVELQRCSDHGQFMNRAADMVLVDVLVREGELARGEKQLNAMLKEYPKSRFLYWTQTRLKISQEKPDEAAESFMILARSYIKDRFIHNGLITAHEAAKLSENSPKQLNKYLDEISQLLPESSVPEQEKGSYKKLMKYRKE